MEKKDVKEWVRSGIEAEASALEQNVNDNQELDGIEMPEDSFADLMARIEASEKNVAAKSPKPFRIRKRTLLAVALVAILIAALGAGATGAKLFVPKVENRGKDGEMSIAVDSDEMYYGEMTEEEVYEEIGEKLGILALRLGYKPNGMELVKVFIDEKMGETQMEFYYGDHILTIYENKQNIDASTNSKPDGVVVDTVEIFHLGEIIEITEIDKGDGELYYRAQLEKGNAYYYLISDVELEEFKSILNGIVFNTI